MILQFTDKFAIDAPQAELTPGGGGKDVRDSIRSPKWVPGQMLGPVRSRLKCQLSLPGGWIPDDNLPVLATTGKMAPFTAPGNCRCSEAVSGKAGYYLALTR